MNNRVGETEIKNDIIEGRNAVIEALRVGRSIDKIFIAKGDVDKTLGHIASKARESGIVVVELSLWSGLTATAPWMKYCSLPRKGAKRPL